MPWAERQFELSRLATASMGAEGRRKSGRSESWRTEMEALRNTALFDKQKVRGVNKSTAGGSILETET